MLSEESRRRLTDADMGRRKVFSQRDDTRVKVKN